MIGHPANADASVVQLMVCGSHTFAAAVPALLPEHRHVSAPTHNMSGLHQVTPLRPVRAAPPTRWAADWCSLGYGVDYSFLSPRQRIWARWHPDQDIMVRLEASEADNCPVIREGLAVVIEELRLLSELPLRLGPEFDHDWNPAAFTEQEIRVSSFDSELATWGHARGTSGICVRRNDGRICAGIAMIDAELGASGGSDRLLGALRHQLGHTLGLGHVHRQGLVMNDQTLPGDWGLGDRLALGMAGGCPSLQEYATQSFNR
jgi:hypothetical protein